MSIPTSTDEPTIDERKAAASLLGGKGGRAGVGAAKRRSPAVIRKAVKARIAANRLRKAQEQRAKA